MRSCKGMHETFRLITWYRISHTSSPLTHDEVNVRQQDNQMEVTVAAGGMNVEVVGACMVGDLSY